MIEDLPNVPPAIPLLAKEFAKSSSWDDARRRMKGLLPELRRQSLVFEQELAAAKWKQEPAAIFDIHLHGALDLFSGQGCSDLRCRVASAERLAQSVGLLADRVWISDHLSERFIDFGRVTNAKLDEVVADTIVLLELLPLIAAGVVQFRSPLTSVCSACLANFDHSVQDTTDFIYKKFKRDFRIEREGNGLYVAHTGKSFEPAMLYRLVPKPGKDVPTTALFARQTIHEESRSALWVARDAAMSGGSVFSNSRIGLAALLHREGRFTDKRSLMILDAERGLNMPWVSDLKPAQIVQLREEASSALPMFREKIAAALSASTRQAKPTALADVISELRVQSEEVRAELQVKRKKSAHFWKVTFGLLGLGISVYGVAADQPAAGVAGLLPLLQLLISHKTGHEADVEKLTTRPGYVFVKAKDILSHATHQ